MGPPEPCLSAAFAAGESGDQEAGDQNVEGPQYDRRDHGQLTGYSLSSLPMHTGWSSPVHPTLLTPASTHRHTQTKTQAHGSVIRPLKLVHACPQAVAQCGHKLNAIKRRPHRQLNPRCRRRLPGFLPPAGLPLPWAQTLQLPPRQFPRRRRMHPAAASHIIFLVAWIARTSRLPHGKEGVERVPIGSNMASMPGDEADMLCKHSISIARYIDVKLAEEIKKSISVATKQIDRRPNIPKGPLQSETGIQKESQPPPLPGSR